MTSPAPVTLIDVARAANVSRTTASAALGGHGRISAETRAHVEAVAARLGYVANPAARHLQGGRKGAIALYESFGFRREGYRKGHYRRGRDYVDAILMAYDVV